MADLDEVVGRSPALRDLVARMGACEAALRLEEAERAAGEARAGFYAIADGVLLSDPTAGSRT
jgi:hypothetical protein